MELIVPLRRTISTPAVLWASMAAAIFLSHEAPALPPPTQQYAAVVRGSFIGSGQLRVTGNNIELSIEVKHRSGSVGVLVVQRLTVANGRFKGQGTVIGRQLTIAGRLDAADSKGPVRTQRLQATFTTDAGDVGRIVAFVGTGDHDRDHDRDRDHDKDKDDD